MVELTALRAFARDGSSFAEGDVFDCDDWRAGFLVRNGDCRLSDGDLSVEMRPFVALVVLRSLGVNVDLTLLKSQKLLAVSKSRSAVAGDVTTSQ